MLLLHLLVSGVGCEVVYTIREEGVGEHMAAKRESPIGYAMPARICPLGYARTASPSPHSPPQLFTHLLTSTNQNQAPAHARPPLTAEVSLRTVRRFRLSRHGSGWRVKIMTPESNKQLYL